MQSLKRLAMDAIPRSIELAERYRLLNEPQLAESICLDILQIEPGNTKVMLMLLLSLTEQFRSGLPTIESRARDLLGRLTSEYEQLYYGGIIYERKAHAKLENNAPHSCSIAYDLLHRAMELYERAEKIRPAGNDDALLRWNTCVRTIAGYELKPRIDDDPEPGLE